MDVTLVSGALVAIFCLFLASLYNLLNRKYNVKNSSLPKLKSCYPLGSWFGLWSRVIGEVDVINTEEKGKLFWAFDGCSPNLFVADTDLIKQVVTEKRDSFKSYRGERVNNSIVRDSLENIERENVKFNGVLTEHNLKKLIPRVERCAEAMVHELKKREPHGGVYIQPCIMQYIGDVIAMTVFGMDLFSDDYKGERPAFMENLNRVFKVDNSTSFSSIMPYVSLGCGYSRKGCLDWSVLPKDAASYFIDLCHSVIENKRKENSGSGSIEGRAYDLIDLLLEATKDDSAEKPLETMGDYVEDITKSQQVERDITVQCLSVILFAVRSTELSLACSVHVLANVEQEQTKIYEEIVKKPSHELFCNEVCLDSEYLELFLKEIHRLYPIEFRLLRESSSAVKLGEVSVDSGVTVSVPIYAIHRQSQLFEEPLEFKPDRFRKEGSPVGYLPLGQASSNPNFIGVRLESVFVKTAVAYLLRTYKLIPPVTEFQAPLDLARGLTEVPVAMPVFLQTQPRA